MYFPFIVDSQKTVTRLFVNTQWRNAALNFGKLK